MHCCHWWIVLDLYLDLQSLGLMQQRMTIQRSDAVVCAVDQRMTPYESCQSLQCSSGYGTMTNVSISSNETGGGLFTWPNIFGLELVLWLLNWIGSSVDNILIYVFSILRADSSIVWIWNWNGMHECFYAFSILWFSIILRSIFCYFFCIVN